MVPTISSQVGSDICYEMLNSLYIIHTRHSKYLEQSSMGVTWKFLWRGWINFTLCQYNHMSIYYIY